MTKVFYGNQYVGNLNLNGQKVTAWRKFKYVTKKGLRVAVMCLFLAGMTSGIFQAGQSSTTPVYVRAEVEVPVEVEIKAPVMDRIIKCESGGKHTVNGQVLVKINTNGSYDTGIAQINSIWNKKATELGYNLSIEKDNIAFANYLFKTYGSEPWYSSKACWNK